MSDIRIDNKFVKVTTESGDLHINSYIESARVETNQPIEQSDNLNNLPVSDLPILPNVGGWCAKDVIYNYNGQAVYCIQGHNRTIYTPEQTPALFSVYRENSNDLDWIINEAVEAGWFRFEDDIKYECIQSHMTLPGWNPSSTTSLWKEYIVGIPVWVQPTGAHDAYQMGDQVYFPTENDSVYESKINANVWSPTAYPAGWKLI
jgi:hypothetical protein